MIRTSFGGGCKPPRKTHKWDQNVHQDEVTKMWWFGCSRWKCAFCGAYSNHEKRPSKKTSKTAAPGVPKIGLVRLNPKGSRRYRYRED